MTGAHKGDVEGAGSTAMSSAGTCQLEGVGDVEGLEVLLLVVDSSSGIYSSGLLRISAWRKERSRSAAIAFLSGFGCLVDFLDDCL